ncbi:MAG: SPOR domain-containing protein [Pseudomonadota bacterium]
MRTLIGAVALSLAIAAGVPALADTKAGVDAWNRGDYITAVAEWRKAAIAGDADAQFNMGQAYKLGRGVPIDLAMAQSWYRKAAVQGHPQAIDNYGLALFQDGKREEALPWLEKSVARGEPRAQLVLGTMLFNGDGVQRDWVRAYALMVRSSAAGLPQGSQTLAEMDKYIPADQRQQGITLAKQYEQQVARNDYPPDIAGGGPTGPAIRTTDVPPSTGPGAPYPVPGKPPKTGKTPPRLTSPVVVADVPPPKAATPKPQPVAKPVPVATGGGWRVQLGAFRDEGNAKALWQDVRGKVAALAGMQPYLRRAGAITKLQAGPIRSGAEADKVCAAVKRTGTACLTVAP